MKYRHLLLASVFCALTTLTQAHDRSWWWNQEFARQLDEEDAIQRQTDEITGALDDLGDKLDNIDRDLRNHEEDPE